MEPWQKKYSRAMRSHWLLWANECGSFSNVAAAFMAAERRDHHRASETVRGRTYQAIGSYFRSIGRTSNPNPPSASCYNENDRREKADEVMSLLSSRAGYHHTSLENPVLPSQVRDGVLSELSRGRPVVMGVLWRSDRGVPGGAAGGDWVLVDSVTSILGSTYVTICDPVGMDVYTVNWGNNASLAYRPNHYFGNQNGGGVLDCYISYQ